jgi:hypothetical protein
MRTSNRRPLSRGASLLAAVTLVAILGVVGFLLQVASPAHDLQSQTAAVGATGPVSPAPTGGYSQAPAQPTPASTGAPAGDTTQPADTTTMADKYPPAQVTCYDPAGTKVVPVYFACYQEGALADVKVFQQNCDPGFEYSVEVVGDKIQVQPTSLQPGQSFCKNPTPPMCKTQNKPALLSYSNAKCRVNIKNISDLAKSGKLQDILANLDPSQIDTGNLSSADQNALSGAYQQAQTTKQNQVQQNTSAINQIQSLIQNGACKSAGCSAEQSQVNQLTQQNADLTKQIKALGDATVSLKPPVNPAPTPTPSPSPTPSPANNTFDSGLGQFLGGLMKGLTGGAGGSGSGSAQQCPYPPAQPDPAQCTTGSWLPSYSGSCMVGWRCTGSGADVPKADLSCSPQIADVGMTLAISYSCSKGTAVGSGFTASGSSGSASPVVETPPAGTNTATYGLTCGNSGATAVAQCSVQVGKPSIVLVTNPKTVDSGNTSLVGWVTSGMDSCVVSSPDQSDFTDRNASNTSTNGTAETSPITKTSTFKLSCTTLAGGTKDATAKVYLTGASSTAITITTDAEGSTVDHGGTMTIQWQANNQDSDARVALWVVNTPDHTTPVALIAGALGTVGSYTWHIPSATSTCPTDGSFNICGNDLKKGTSYAIEADIYTPHDAYVGDGAPPASPITPAYGDYADTGDFTIGN